MKKLLVILLSVLTVLSLCISAFAADSEIRLTVNGKAVVFPDEQPYLDGAHRTMVPIRFVTEAMGAEVNWDENTKTATMTLKDRTVYVTIGQQSIKVETPTATKFVTMDTAAVIKNGRTFVPIRFVVEGLGGFVDYSNEYGIAEIVYAEEVTAEEITRLRSYKPSTWYTDYFKNVNKELDPTANKIFSNANNKSWFADAHQLLLTCQPTAWEVRSLEQGISVPQGTAPYDYAKAAVSWVNAETEVKEFVGAITKFKNSGAWARSDSNWNIDVNFKTDLSLAYHPNAPVQSVIAVRGIMEVTPHEGTDATYFKQKFGVDLELEKTISVDMEFLVARDKYGYFNEVAVFRYDANGNAVSARTK